MNLHLQLALDLGKLAIPGRKLDTQRFLYVTQKREKGEVLEQEERSRCDPRKSLHLSHLPIGSLSCTCNSPHPWVH